MKFDSTELVKTQLRIDGLKLELDSFKEEEEKTQFIIDKLRRENILLEELMKKYLIQINRKREIQEEE